MSQTNSLTHAIFQKATEKELKYSEKAKSTFTFPNKPCVPVTDAVFDGDENESSPTR